MLQKKRNTGKYRIGRRFFTAMLVMVMVLLQMSGVQAEETSYQTQEGIVAYGSGEASIVIEGNAGQSLAGKQFQLHRLFEAENAKESESIDYTINPTYTTVLQKVVGQKLNKSPDAVTEYEITDYMIGMNTEMLEGAQVEQPTESRDGEYRHFVEALAEEIANENISGSLIDVKETKSNNTVEITGLPYGYYMVMDVSETEGEHTALSMPMLSTTNPTSTMKLKADYPTMVAKICEDTGAVWNDVADYEMGENIWYRYESKIPNINGYQSYYYTWHTEMDEALTLKEGTIGITMTGTYNAANKIYSLKSNEYQLIRNESNNSFTIEIQDIKAIVDREYGKDTSTGQGVYGQSVIVLYKATLNEKALSRMGVPAFETDARLEFSNNPTLSKESEHGFTPWDTVVCFTYRINGQKVNNYGTELEGAKFRLYRDQACTREVLVKSVEKQYLIMHDNSVTEEDRLLATEIESDADGNFSIYGLDADTYYLKEVEAPSGYRPLTEPIQVVLKANVTGKRFQYIKGEGKESSYLLLNATAKYKSFVEGVESEKEMVLTANPENASVALSVVNHVGRKLPVTGTSAILILTICGISCIGMALLRGRKKHE